MSRASSAITLFLDTNTFLHFKPTEEINWPELVNVSRIKLVVCQAVIRELNKVKDRGPDKKTRHRAGSTLHRMSALLDHPAPVYVREDVELCFRNTDPIIDFAHHKLNTDLSDDWLLATILEYRDELPDENLALVTNDLGLKLKAAGHQVCCVGLVEQYKLPEEIDADQKRIQELEREVATYRQRIPDLKLLFSQPSEQTKHIKLQLEKKPLLTEEELVRKMNDARAPYPKKARPAGYSAFHINMSMPTTQDIDRYNDRLDGYFANYERYLRETNEAIDTQARMFSFQVILLNNGSCPAEDIDIRLHLPDGLQVYEDADTPCKFPSEPKPPLGPMTLFEETMKNHAFTLNNILSPNFAAINAFNAVTAGPAKISGPKIRRTNSFEVTYHVLELKHRCVADFDPLFAVFDSWETAKPLSLKYEILAGNVPEPVNGQLHIVIEVK